MRDRLYTAAVVVLVLAGMLVVFLVFKFGQHNPSPPSLDDNPRPEIPGALVYLDSDNCLVRAEASGASREDLTCLANPSLGALTWVDANRIAFWQYGPAGVLQWSVFDLSTRKVTATAAVADPGKVWNPSGTATSINGESATADNKTGKVFRISDGVRTEIADFDVRDYGGPNIVTWSPDGQWLLLQYYREGGESELWIISRDGAVQGTLTKDAISGLASWIIDGAIAPKVDLPALQ